MTGSGGFGLKGLGAGGSARGQVAWGKQKHHADAQVDGTRSQEALGSSEERRRTRDGAGTQAGEAAAGGVDGEALDLMEELLEEGAELATMVEEGVAGELVEQLMGQPQQHTLGALVARCFEHRIARKQQQQQRQGGQESVEGAEATLGWHKRLVRKGTRMYVAAIGDSVGIHYTCTLANKQEIDSSYKRKSPLVLRVGSGGGACVIRGLEQGIVGMCLGDKAELHVTSPAAYASRGGPSLFHVVAPGADLTFELEIVHINGVAVEDAEAPPTPSATSAASVADCPAAAPPPPPPRRDDPLYVSVPPDVSDVVRAGSIEALRALLVQMLPGKELEQEQAHVWHLTEQLVEEAAEVLSQLAPAQASEAVSGSLLPQRTYEDGTGHDAGALLLHQHLRSIVASMKGERRGEEAVGELGDQGKIHPGEPAGNASWTLLARKVRALLCSKELQLRTCVKQHTCLLCQMADMSAV